MTISSKVDSKWLKIYLNNTPHFAVYLDDVVSWTAWIEIENWFCIYVYLEDRLEPLLLEYSSEDLWKSVLKVLDENI